MPVLNKPFVLLNKVDNINDTERGGSGFGSTGLQ
jgi:dUTPase